MSYSESLHIQCFVVVIGFPALASVYCSIMYDVKFGKHETPAVAYNPQCQQDNDRIDGRSQIKVHTDERTQVHSARSSLLVTHPSSN